MRDVELQAFERWAHEHGQYLADILEAVRALKPCEAPPPLGDPGGTEPAPRPDQEHWRGYREGRALQERVAAQMVEMNRQLEEAVRLRRERNELRREVETLRVENERLRASLDIDCSEIKTSKEERAELKRFREDEAELGHYSWGVEAELKRFRAREKLLKPLIDAMTGEVALLRQLGGHSAMANELELRIAAVRDFKVST